jgi:glyoxylase-like metal-dependent hydrolase (beta-lactamase superfamily II)
MDLVPFPRAGSFRTLTLPLPGFADLICSNIFVLGQGPLTLIDTGPKFPGSFESLEQQLKSIGFAWRDVERIVVTHGHIDHFGLVVMIRKAAGHDIPCYIHADDLWRLSRGFIEQGMWSEEAEQFSAFAGIPAAAVKQMKQRSDFFKVLCDPVDDALPIQDGDVFRGSDFELRLIHTPGHSPGSCCLFEQETGVLFSGDTLIKHITPNPFHETNRSRLSDPAYKSLKAYRLSLQKLEQLPVRATFPAHGECIPDLKKLIEGYRAHHDQRSEQIRKALMDSRRCLYELVREVFPTIKEAEVFLGVSEVFVHLELLIEAGQVVVVDEGPPALFHAC